MRQKLHVFHNSKIIYFLLFLFGCLGQINAQTIEMGLGTRRTLPPDFYGYDMSTTVRGGVSLVEPNFLSHLPLLKPKTLRYPSGGHANWWDWRVGWYVDSPYLPKKHQGFTKVPNRLEDLKGVLTATGATAILDLNMLTSNVRDQIAMLKHADSIGVEVKYIELGNEFFLEGDGADDSVYLLIQYPTPESYADTAQIWIDSIRKHFPDAKIGLQGVFDKNNKERRNLWNDAVIAPVEGEDAITMHYYYGSHYSDSLETVAEKLDVNMGDLPDWFYQPYKAWDILVNKSMNKVPADEDVWITEYNFSDHERPTHGTWASGLYTALHGMQLLQDDRIKIIDLHGVDGQAVYGAYFYDTKGYQFGLQEEADFTGPEIKPVTQAWGLNAYGHTMTMVGNAMSAQTFASRIEFSPNPQVTAVEFGKSFLYNGLFGYLFNNANSSQAIVLNVTGNSQTLKTNLIFPAGGTYELRTAPVLGLVTGNSSVNITTGNLPQNYVMPPYSIIRMQGNTIPQVPPQVSITADGPLTFCADDSVVLDAGPNYYAYLWSTGATTRKITVKVTGDFWVHAYKIQGGYYGSAEISIKVNPLPVKPNVMPDGSKTFCQGGSVVLHPGPNTVYQNATYYWPLTGHTTWASTATTTGGHYLIVTDSNGCSIISDPEYITVNPLPQPVITPVGPLAACYDVDVTLQANPGYNNYSWSNGGFGQTKTFGVSGSYSVTVTDGNNCKGTSAPLTVTVWEPPIPTISTSSGTTTFCDNAGVYLTTSANSSAYQWQKSGVNIAGATSSNYLPISGGSYKVITTDINGCSKTSASLSITVKVHPSPTITGPSSICQGSIATLSTGSYSSYLWSSGQTTPSIQVASSGTFSVSVTDANGCTGTSANKTITVNPLPTPSISAMGATSFCDGGSVVLDAGSGYTKYSWSNGKATQTNTVTASGTFTVTVTNAGGCTATSAPVTVTEWILPNPAITAVGPTTYCAGAGSYLTTISGYSYQWLKGTVNQVGATNQNFAPTSTGTYKVKITDSHGCSKTAATGVQMTVYAAPTASISVTTGSTNICSGQTATLKATTGSGYTYLWKKNGLTIAGATSSSYVASLAGDYTCTVTNTNGCTKISNVVAITNNCKGNEGLTSNEKVEWLIYPNPAHEKVHVQLLLPETENGNCDLELRNILGEIIYTTKLSFDMHKISTDIYLDRSLASGLYFIIVKQGEGLYRNPFMISKH